MDTTAVAGWLNSVFGPFDFAILSTLHTLAESAGFLLTPLFEVVGLLGEKGTCFFVFSVVLMFFRRTRWTGICLFVAICLGALMTNIVLKDLIERPRPFEAMEVYADWWCFVGSPAEEGFSFPSGHVTAAAAAMTAWMLMRRSVDAALAGVTVVAVMGVSRSYLMAHYPSDVLAGCMVGVLAALVAFVLVGAVYRRWVCYRSKVSRSHL